MIKIKVLKDTPFDKAGQELSIDDFRLKYNYCFAGSVNNDDVVSYIRQKPPILNEFFRIAECPLNFIYEGVVYRKEMDGSYHKYIPGTSFTRETSVGIIEIPEAEQLVLNAKFSKECLYLSNDVHRKL